MGCVFCFLYYYIGMVIEFIDSVGKYGFICEDVIYVMQIFEVFMFYFDYFCIDGLDVVVWVGFVSGGSIIEVFVVLVFLDMVIVFYCMDVWVMIIVKLNGEWVWVLFLLGLILMFWLSGLSVMSWFMFCKLVLCFGVSMLCVLVVYFLVEDGLFLVWIMLLVSVGCFVVSYGLIYVLMCDLMFM